MFFHESVAMGYVFPLLTVDEIVKVLRSSARFPDVGIDVLTKPQNYVTASVTDSYDQFHHAKNSQCGLAVCAAGGHGSGTVPGSSSAVGILDIYVAFWDFLSSTADIRMVPWHEILQSEG